MATLFLLIYLKYLFKKEKVPVRNPEIVFRDYLKRRTL